MKYFFFFWLNDSRKVRQINLFKLSSYSYICILSIKNSLFQGLVTRESRFTFIFSFSSRGDAFPRFLENLWLIPVSLCSGVVGGRFYFTSYITTTLLASLVGEIFLTVPSETPNSIAKSLCIMVGSFFCWHIKSNFLTPLNLYCF